MKMKLFFYISSLILLTCFSACKRPAYPPVMQQAEALMETRPDSALYLLEGMADTLAMLPDEARMYWHLLTIQAKDKQYITHTDDSLINRIVEFCEDDGNDERLMMAYYYLGSTYRDMNDAPRALKAFQQALDLNVPNYDLQAKAYNQMGTLFMYQGLHDEVIRVNRKAIELYLSQGKRNKISYAQRDIARMYDVKNVPDSALHYYQEACRTALEDGDSVRYYGILGELGGYYCETGEQEKAKQLLRLIESLPSVPNKIHIYSMLGELYEDINQLDSAGYYYAKNLGQKNTRDIYYSYKGLYEIEKSKGNYKQAQEYLDKALILKDCLDNAMQTESVTKINALYNYQHIENERQHLKLKNEEQQKHKLFLLLICLSIALSSVIVFYKQKEKRRKELETEKLLRSMAENNYATSKKAILENEEKIKELDMMLQEALKEKDLLKAEQVQVQQERLQMHNEEIVLIQKEKELRIAVLRRSSVYQEFKQAATDETINLSSTNRPDKWESLRKAIDIAYPDFSERLHLTCPNLSATEVQVCLLTKLGISPSGIATIQKCSRQGISNTRTRIHKKIQEAGGSYSKFDDFIDSF